MRTTSALALLASLLLSSAAEAGTILVDLNGGGDYLTIKGALQVAVTGDTLLIFLGEYTGINNRALNPGGKELTFVGVAGPDSTIINCQMEDRAFTFASGEDSTYVIGLTVKQGETGEDEPGGAVICDGSSPTFLDCVFLGNRAYAGGGAVQCLDASPTFQDCQFIDNIGTYGGGLISKGVSHPVLVDVLFDGNHATWTGGMRCETGDATLTNVTFLDNESVKSAGGFGGFGGGAYSISSSVFVGNVAEEGPGGGAACAHTNLSITNCTFIGNSAATGSAIGTTATTSLSIDTSILAFGLTPGVLSCVGSAPTVTHCCVYGNAGGDSLCGYYHDNLFSDPLFCDRPGGDYTLYDISPCLPGNNPWGVLIGGFEQGCIYPGPLPPPAGLTAVPDDEMATVRWHPVTSDILDYYRLERDDSSLFGPETVVLTTTDTVVVDAPLLDGVEYFYRVFAVDVFHIDSASSDTVSCAIAPTPPAAPVDLTAAVGNRLVDLSWRENDDHDLDHYVVYRDTVAGFTPGDAYAVSSENAFPDTAVTNYISYYYRVAAVDTSDLVSEPSSEVRAVPHGRLPAVCGLEATPGDTSVFLTWRRIEPPCEHYYKVYRDTAPDMVSLAVLYDGFEMYEPGEPPPAPPWNVTQQSGTAVRVTDFHHAVGAQSVALRDSSSGFLRLFASLGDSGHQAPRVRFQVRPGASRPAINLVQFEIFGEAGIGYPAGVLEVCDGSLRHWVVGSDPETLGLCEPEAWHGVEWYLDCESDTYGVWLDGERVAGGVPFFNDAEQLGIVQIRTRNLEWGEAWVDELFVGGHVQSITATQDTTFLDEPLSTGVKYYYKVAAVDTFGVEGFPSEVVAVVPGWVGIGDVDEESVAAAFFRPGSPNPFETRTSLRYGVPSPGAAVRIRVYDVSGRRVKTLVDERQDGGVYGLAWDGRDEIGLAVASGVYFVRAEIGSWSGTRKVAVMR